MNKIQLLLCAFFVSLCGCVFEQRDSLPLQFIPQPAINLPPPEATPTDHINFPLWPLPLIGLPISAILLYALLKPSTPNIQQPPKEEIPLVIKPPSILREEFDAEVSAERLKKFALYAPAGTAQEPQIYKVENPDIEDVYKFLCDLKELKIKENHKYIHANVVSYLKAIKDAEDKGEAVKPMLLEFVYRYLQKPTIWHQDFSFDMGIYEYIGIKLATYIRAAYWMGMGREKDRQAETKQRLRIRFDRTVPSQIKEFDLPQPEGMVILREENQKFQFGSNFLEITDDNLDELLEDVFGVLYEVSICDETCYTIKNESDFKEELKKFNVNAEKQEYDFSILKKMVYSYLKNPSFYSTLNDGLKDPAYKYEVTLIAICIKAAQIMQIKNTR